MTGPAFLLLYAALIALGLVAGSLRRNYLMGGKLTPGEKPLSPLQIAYLTRGPEGALSAAVATLLQHGQLHWNGQALEPVKAPPGKAEPLEAAVYLAAKDAVNGLPHPIPRHCEQPLLALRQKLQREGLLMEAEKRLQAERVFLPVLFALLAIGIARLAWGMGHGRPVKFLIIEMVVVTFVMLLGSARRLPLTHRGVATVKALRKEHDALRINAKAQPSLLAPTDAVLAAGLFGLPLAALEAGPAFATMHAADGFGPILSQDRRWSANAQLNTGSGGDGGDGGGGDGGGCGGGCGGGGCGG